MPKLLRDFLHEQQEPFSMELYLLERGYNSDKVSRFSQKEARNAASNYAYLFKSVINRLTYAKDNKKIQSTSIHIRDQEKSRKQHEYAEEDDELSSSRSRKSYYDAFSAKESRKSTSMEDTTIAKQLSPVSVLEETESHEEDSPLHHRTEHFKTTTTAKGESSSASKPQRFSNTSDHHQYITNKRILHESQKLLIDTVREVIEVHKQIRGKRGEKKQQAKRILMGPDELWKLVCEYLWAWSKDVVIDESNVVQLLHCDFLGSQEDWKNDYCYPRVDPTPWQNSRPISTNLTAPFKEDPSITTGPRTKRPNLR